MQRSRNSYEELTTEATELTEKSDELPSVISVHSVVRSFSRRLSRENACWKNRKLRACGAECIRRWVAVAFKSNLMDNLTIEPLVVHGMMQRGVKFFLLD